MNIYIIILIICVFSTIYILYSFNTEYFEDINTLRNNMVTRRDERRKLTRQRIERQREAEAVAMRKRQQSKELIQKLNSKAKAEYDSAMKSGLSSDLDTSNNVSVINKNNDIVKPNKIVLNAYSDPTTSFTNTGKAYHLHNKKFHNYTYNYKGFEKDMNNTLLTFMCIKTEGIMLSNWNKEYDNVLNMIKEYCPCKTSDVYDLREEILSFNDIDRKETFKITHPLNSHLVKRLVEKDIQTKMFPYSELIEKYNGIIAPVYAIVIQYPNRWYTSSDGDSGYRTTFFDLRDDIYRPYERIHVHPRHINTKDNIGVVDTKILFLYPMYHKTKIQFYETYCNIYQFKLKLSDYLEYELSLKGIVDMIKFLTGDKIVENMPVPLKITKTQQCFVHCNNDLDYSCGCGTRHHVVQKGNDGKYTEPTDNKYNSYCKDVNEDTIENEEMRLSNYGMVYRINELTSPLIYDIKMNSDTEKKIGILVDTKNEDNLCRAPVLVDSDNVTSSMINNVIGS